MKAGISVRLFAFVLCRELFIQSTSHVAGVLLWTQGSTVSHYGAIWTRDTIRINKLQSSVSRKRSLEFICSESTSENHSLKMQHSRIAPFHLCLSEISPSERPFHHYFVRYNSRLSMLKMQLSRILLFDCDFLEYHNLRFQMISRQTYYCLKTQLCFDT